MTTFFLTLRVSKSIMLDSRSRKTAKKLSNIRRYDKMSKKRSRFSYLRLGETINVFSRVSKDMNLQSRSVWNKVCKTTHTNNKLSGKMFVISISRLVTNGSDLVQVEDGVGDTFTHIYTYKEKSKINANLAFMYEVMNAGQGRGTGNSKRGLETQYLFDGVGLLCNLVQIELDQLIALARSYNQ